jgi:hypothetical protein
MMIGYSMGLCLLAFGKGRPLAAVATLILLAAHETQKNQMANLNFIMVMLLLGSSNILYAISLSPEAYENFSCQSIWEAVFENQFAAES